MNCVNAAYWIICIITDSVSRDLNFACINKLKSIIFKLQYMTVRNHSPKWQPGQGKNTSASIHPTKLVIRFGYINFHLSIMHTIGSSENWWRDKLRLDSCKISQCGHAARRVMQTWTVTYLLLKTLTTTKTHRLSHCLWAKHFKAMGFFSRIENQSKPGVVGTWE